jgi:hypothetical protein
MASEPFGPPPDLTPCPGCGFSSGGVTAGCVECCRRNPEQFAEMSSEISAMGDEAREAVIASERAIRLVRWVSRLDQPDPDPSEEGARRLLTVDKLAALAREALA